MSSIETVMIYTVNQLLFTMDLFHNLLPINCFAKTNVCNQGISKLIGYNNHITTIGLLREYLRQRCPLVKISPTRITADLQYLKISLINIHVHCNKILGIEIHC